MEARSGVIVFGLGLVGGAMLGRSVLEGMKDGLDKKQRASAFAVGLSAAALVVANEYYGLDYRYLTPEGILSLFSDDE